MGIDPSMRSTGVYYDGRYYLIGCAFARKVMAANLDGVTILSYEYTSAENKSGIDKEWAKTQNIMTIVRIINNLLDNIRPDRVCVEAIAMRAGGMVDVLAGLNYAIRMSCIDRMIPVYAVSPSANKKNFTGRGNATKGMMLEAWRGVESRDFSALGKHCDDMADAYALSLMPLSDDV